MRLLSGRTGIFGKQWSKGNDVCFAGDSRVEPGAINKACKWEEWVLRIGGLGWASAHSEAWGWLERRPWSDAVV